MSTAGRPFTKQEDDQITQLRAQGLTWSMIGRHMGRSGDVVRRRHKRLDVAAVLVEAARLCTDDDSMTYDKLAVQWNEWLGRTVAEVPEAPPIKWPVGLRRVGIISDTHCPYESRGVLAAFVADGPYDLVIHGGDLLDWYAVSSFVKRRHVDPRLEIQHGTWVLEVLAGIATEVEVVSDNHGRRLLKAVMKANLPGALMEILEWFKPELDLFKLMVRDLPNVKIADPVEVVEGVHFFGQYGDLVVGHADTSSKLKLRAAENLDTWLREWKGPLGLKPWNVVAQAHTHRLGVAYGAGGYKAYMELGACCTLEAMAYALQGKVGYRPPVPAYTTLEQHKGEDGNWYTDLNSIKQTIIKGGKTNERH